MDQSDTASPQHACEASEKGATSPLANDILYGADAIAEFVHGAKTFRRSIYNLVETNRIPHFRIGAIICARKSVLLAWIATQEAASTQG